MIEKGKKDKIMKKNIGNVLALYPTPAPLWS